ncbi:dienelactone hydrolase family protein [Mesobacterium pallidum]|uniref:dienelactone hydrolase family protein n=1 Tax=Mesobacterium pallidum TaxID=2872037 RepID=UPI001EE223AD|nr:dienelactone hydrolase family protein [Mesobacterium pallidum]
MPEHIYDADGTPCHGYLALPGGDGPAAGVLVTPAFSGLSDSERATCDRLAALGYVALGVDYYGHGTLATTREEAGALMAKLQADRATLATRMTAALAALAAIPRVDAGRMAAMGYCFGGKAVLDLARSGADFRAGVSMHGVYDAPPSGSRKMAPALLICHGWEDPLCPPDATVALAQELTEHCDDWQILAHGHTGHAFTNPGANAPGMAYAEAADRRSWDAMLSLFAETLGA